MHRCIAHLDMDAFYVSVELQRRPDLVGKPVVVAGSGPRAVVTTASYEARKFGVFSATPASRARRLCPDAVFIPPDFKHYRERSRAVMGVLRAHIDRVEVVGLDEAYLDLSQFERPKAAARRVQAAIEQETGLGCSIGIGPSKLVAKVASDAEKPNGFVVLSREGARERFGPSPPGLIPGIGPKTAERLAEQGIDTLARLAVAPETALTSWFGPRLGPHLRRLARFEHESPVTTVRVAKSESRETTFDYDLNGLDALIPVLERLAGELCETLDREERRGPTVGIKVPSTTSRRTLARARSTRRPTTATS
jgi:DNA polymerase-4